MFLLWAKHLNYYGAAVASHSCAVVILFGNALIKKYFNHKGHKGKH